MLQLQQSVRLKVKSGTVVGVNSEYCFVQIVELHPGFPFLHFSSIRTNNE